MKKRTSNVSRRIVSLLMSMVLTLTLVTPAAFATEVVGGSGTAIIEGDTNPADANPNEDAEGGDTEDKDNEDSGDEQQPADPGDEGKNPDEGDGGSDDANKPGEDNKGKQNTEDENNSEDDIAPLNDDTDSDVWDGKPAEKFAGGAGTVDDPYKISTGAELAYLAEKVNGGESYSGEYFKLTNDIQLNELDENGMPKAADGQDKAFPWTPIGKFVKSSNKQPFSGIFDGDGHTISGLYINLTGNYKSNSKGKVYQGLFGYVKGGTVQNLIVTGSVAVKNTCINVDVSYIGGIVGCTDGTVQNCGFYGTISAKKNVLESPTDCSTTNNGGVVGNGEATNCWYFCTDIENASLLNGITFFPQEPPYLLTIPIYWEIKLY